MNWKTGKCSNCGGGLHLGHCPEWPDPYGVPTGYVPRVETSGFMRVDHSMKIRGNPLPSLRVPPDPVTQAVDAYLLMERKAKAWDVLRQRLFPSEARVHAVMDELLKPPA